MLILVNEQSLLKKCQLHSLYPKRSTHKNLSAGRKLQLLSASLVLRYSTLSGTAPALSHFQLPYPVACKFHPWELRSSHLLPGYPQKPASSYHQHTLQWGSASCHAFTLSDDKFKLVQGMVLREKHLKLNVINGGIPIGLLHHEPIGSF